LEIGLGFGSSENQNGIQAFESTQPIGDPRAFTISPAQLTLDRNSSSSVKQTLLDTSIGGPFDNENFNFDSWSVGREGCRSNLCIWL